MGAAEVGVDGHVHLYDLYLLLHVVVIGADGGDLFVEHEMGGPKLIVDILGANL